MAAGGVHIGDSWVFDRANVTFPIDPPMIGGWITLGAGISQVLIPAEIYHATLTGEIEWVRPATGPVALVLEMDLDFFDATTGVQIDGPPDSDMYPRFRNLEDESSGAATIKFPFIAQSVFEAPPNCELRLRVLSRNGGYGAMLNMGRLVCSVVTLKVA